MTLLADAAANLLRTLLQEAGSPFRAGERNADLALATGTRRTVVAALARLEAGEIPDDLILARTVVLAAGLRLPGEGGPA